MGGERKIRLYDEPLRGGVICEHCCEEIEAYGEEIVSFIISGTRPYVWRHVASRLDYCTHRYQARPYDGWAACRQIREAESARAEVEEHATVSPASTTNREEEGT